MRVNAGLSISDLAKRSGLARSIVGLIDQGRLVPSPEEARAFIRGIEEG
jgi:ribosome-binding protein aMBF1 (putative translation factor)